MHKLMSTRDYSKFELCQFNRNVSKIKNLKASMKQHGFIPAYPLHVLKNGNGLLKIKAGHHRFEVAQQLGQIIYYVVCDDHATIHELEKATTRWSIDDYLESHVRCGNPEYIAFKEFKQTTGISTQNCMSILSGEVAGSGNKLQHFKDGDFKITTKEFADRVADIVLFCTGCGIEATRTLFVQAVSRCLCIKEFDVETFKVRASANRQMLVPQRQLWDQVELLEQVYNYKSHQVNKVPIAFLVKQEMANRSVIKGKKKQ